MPSKDEKREAPQTAFVWIWLPDADEPIVAGRIDRDGEFYTFAYGQSYIAHKQAIPIYLPELPLKRDTVLPNAPLMMANCLRDGAPDAWGRRVVINRLTGLKGEAAKDVEFDELTFMLNSGSDRAGALDFQFSADAYKPRDQANATLEQLMMAAEFIERGEPIPQALDNALFHGSSIGGARPKALIEDGTTKYIAKFSATNDTYSVVKAEFIAMRLAARVGLSVAPVSLRSVAGKDVLLVERFDRTRAGDAWRRRAMVSAPHAVRPRRIVGAPCELHRTLRHHPRALHRTAGDVARVVRADGLQRAGRQYRRSCAQSCGVLGRVTPHADPGLRHLPATAKRTRGEPGDRHRRQRT